MPYRCMSVTSLQKHLASHPDVKRREYLDTRTVIKYVKVLAFFLVCEWRLDQ